MNESSSSLLAIVVSFIFVVLTICYCVRLSHEEAMGKLGYQECLEDKRILWQKECYKID